MKRFLSILIILGLGGCSTIKMGVNQSTQQIDLKGKGMLLMTLDISNTFKPGRYPHMRTLHVVSLKPSGQDDKTFRFRPDADGTIKSEDSIRYLFRMPLPEGEYVIKSAGLTQGWLEQAWGLLPIISDVEVKANTITYIGHINSTIVKRNKGEARVAEFNAYNAYAGFSGGRFDTEITDQMVSDTSQYIALYPALKGEPIEKDILAPYNREVAETWSTGARGFMNYDVMKSDTCRPSLHKNQKGLKNLDSSCIPTD